MNARFAKSIPYEAVVIAATPALGYVVAYLFELGLFTRLGVPVELIRVDTESVIRVSIVLGVVGLFLVPLASELSLIRPKQTQTLRWHLWRHLARPLALFVVVAVIYKGNMSAFGLGLSAVIVSTTLFSMEPFLFAVKRDFTGSYLERVRRRVVLYEMREPKTWADKTSERFGARSFGLGVTAVFMGLALVAAGDSKGLHQERWLVDSQTGDVVISLSGDRAVMAKRSSASLIGSFRVLELNDKTDLVYAQIGRLRRAN